MSTLTTPDDAEARIARFLEEALLTGRDPRLEPLAGDASNRRYYRLRVSGLSPRILALYPAGDTAALATFVAVAALLAKMPVPVPRVIARADDLGILLLEDLGDVSLQARLATADPAARAALYGAAVDLIATLQRRGAELADPACPPYALAFDEAKLTAELDFFTTHFVEGHRGVAVAPAAREALDREYHALAAALAAEPRVLCHRDFHSRNLMVRGEGLWIIDFQDARMGPDTYDLVSLLRDAYVEVPDAEADALIARFLAATAGADPAAFRARFDRMAVQRTLKALGTFGYQAAARGNPAYLEYVPRTLGHARASLAAWPGGARLRELLAALVPELA